MGSTHGDQAHRVLCRKSLLKRFWFQNIDFCSIYQVHEYLRSKLCSLYESDCIFDKFECCWNGNDSAIMTGSYNNFFRMFDRTTKRDLTLEASREVAKPRTVLKPRKVRLFCSALESCIKLFAAKATQKIHWLQRIFSSGPLKCKFYMWFFCGVSSTKKAILAGIVHRMPFFLIIYHLRHWFLFYGPFAC